MKAAYYFFLLLILFSFLSQISHADNNRHALVIGNSNYENSPLKNPVNDARAISKTLKEVGFNVIELLDADMRKMDEAVAKFGRNLEKHGGVGLFYYAGHGIQYQGKNFLIPLAANISKETDLKYETFDSSKVFDEMGYADNGLNIVILDACRDNPLTRSFRSSKRGLAKPDDTPSGLLLAFSTSPGKQAADGTGKNSPYTTHLIKAMKKEGVPLELAFKSVIRNVKEETRGEQIPWVSSSVDGDFYFVKPKPLPVKKVEKVVTTDPYRFDKGAISANNLSKYELLYWEWVINKPAKEKYNSYLKKYPNGHFKEIAESELKQFTTPRTLPPKTLPPKKVTSRKLPSKTVVATPSKEDIIAKKFKSCDQHLNAFRLSSGPDGNAYDCYRNILAMDPDNAEAVLGLKKVEYAYIHLIRKAKKNNDREKVKRYIGKLENINSSNKTLPVLRKFLIDNKASQSNQEKKISPSNSNYVSQEQQQIFEEYAEIVSEMLDEKSLSKKQLVKVNKYMSKLKNINSSDPIYLSLRQKLNRSHSSNKHSAPKVSEEQQQIFDEFLEVVEEMLQERPLSKKQQRKLKKYLIKLEEIDPESQELARIKKQYKIKR